MTKTEKLYAKQSKAWSDFWKDHSMNNQKHWDKWHKIRRKIDVEIQASLPEQIRELNQIARYMNITIWEWHYPWNHPHQPKQFKNTLTLTGDGSVTARIDPISMEGKGEYVILEKPDQFMSKRSKRWKRLRVGEKLTFRQMKFLTKQLV